MSILHKIRRLQVPAKIYDQGLRFVNRRRRDKGLRPIKRLPAGLGWQPGSCPCAVKCGGKISVVGEIWHWGHGPANLEFGDGPEEFTEYFDNGTKGDGEPVLPVRGMRRATR